MNSDPTGSSCKVTFYRTPSNMLDKQVEPLIPPLPWQKVGVDLFEYKSFLYVIVIDYFSHFIEITKLTGSHKLLKSSHLPDMANMNKCLV